MSILANASNFDPPYEGRVAKRREMGVVNVVENSAAPTADL
jgi:hypothetical protein